MNFNADSESNLKILIKVFFPPNNDLFKTKKFNIQTLQIEEKQTSERNSLIMKPRSKHSNIISNPMLFSNSCTDGIGREEETRRKVFLKAAIFVRYSFKMGAGFFLFLKCRISVRLPASSFQNEVSGMAVNNLPYIYLFHTQLFCLGGGGVDNF